MPLSETRPRVVDIHAHLVPFGLIEEAMRSELPNVHVVDHGPDRYSFAIAGSETRVLRSDLIDVAKRTAWMDRRGIDLQVVGTWADIFGYSLEEEEAVAWARMSNRALLEATRRSDRLEALATLPMQAPLAAAEMIPEIVADGFAGVTFAARVEATELDHPSLEPLWAALSDHEVVAFIHPGYADKDPRTDDYGMVNAVGRPVDTTIAAARMIGADIPTKYPGAKIVLAHGGGAIAFILGRLLRNLEIDPEVGNPEIGLRSMYFDTVMFDPDALCYLVAKTSADSVLLGSDYPFPIGDHSPVDIVMSAPCLTSEQRRSVMGGTAERIMPLSGTTG